MHRRVSTTKARTKTMKHLPRHTDHANKSFSVVSIVFYFKNLSTNLMVVAFVYAIITIPQQQRRLLSSILKQSPPSQSTSSMNILHVTHPILDGGATTKTATLLITDITVTADDNTATMEHQHPGTILPTQQTTSTKRKASQSEQRLESGHLVLPVVLPQKNENETTSITTNDRFGGIVARPFTAWPNGKALPCYQPNEGWNSLNVQNTPSQRGFLYVKPYKTGSSTTSGVNLRIARNVAKRHTTLNITICDARFDHGPTFHPGKTLFRIRSRNESFLWSVLRDPTKRAISQFFHFEVSRRKIEPSDANLIEFLSQRRDMLQDYYHRALYTKSVFNRSSFSPIRTANDILRTYNFIGITERLDESFVVLMMLLRLKMADILYLSAKTRGGYDDGGGREQKHTCTYIWPSFVTTGVDEYLKSKEWRDTIRYDVLLYEAVNRSLDMTIDALGRHEFNDNLQKYRHAQQVAIEKCLATTIFPCDTGGNYHVSTDCIWNDSGCGASCLDDVATELNLW